MDVPRQENLGADRRPNNMDAPRQENLASENGASRNGAEPNAAATNGAAPTAAAPTAAAAPEVELMGRPTPRPPPQQRGPPPRPRSFESRPPPRDTYQRQGPPDFSRPPPLDTYQRQGPPDFSRPPQGMSSDRNTEDRRESEPRRRPVQESLEDEQEGFQGSGDARGPRDGFRGAAGPVDALTRPGQRAPPTTAPPSMPPRLSDQRRKGSRGPSAEQDDAEFRARMAKKTGKTGKSGKVDLGARRSARSQKRDKRKQAALDNALVREEIFEVGPEGMPVAELADRLAINPTEVVMKLFVKGLMVQVNSTLDKEAIKLVAEEYGVDVIDKDEEDVTSAAKKTVDYLEDEDADFLQPRPPVVTVMGHVDHGKTSLLDFIRKTKVAAGEAGGITQAIGAYTVGVDTGEVDDQTRHQVTFLDTPGHEAFSAMRARGTKVTDIAIIVVAADDGVRPQTVEAISHARAAEVPIVVAINKVDKEGAQIDRVKQELSEAGLLPEEWGGSTPMVAISAKKGTGIDELLETVLLVAEVEQLMANPDKAARGTVIESHLDKKSGAVASVLVAAGTLRVGDVVSAGAAYGRVRSLGDSTGEVQQAGPSIAVQVTGMNSVSVAGDEFYVHDSLDEARKIAEAVEASQRLERLSQFAGSSMVTTKSFASIDDEESEALQRLNIILKADASGSLEAVKAALGALPQDNVMLRFLLTAANEITESDIDLAFASDGYVIGFNVAPSEAVQAAAKNRGVDVRTYKVIYDLVDDMRAAMEGRLAPVEERTAIGNAVVRAAFGSGSRRVAGCMVTDGVLRKGCTVKVSRNGRTLHEGEVISLRRIKDDVKEVTNGLECGMGVEGFNEWREDDQIEAYEVKAKQRTLEEAAAPA
ncbi:hypothetical protein WJX72_009524 [[Myrmecia] bisecta]|uniref:Translation initiation factor IF-2, chloroplastic n=1 Tax=[Myrmecia] bisecta TaxID=41462 RepID=A0AAW1Q2W4_9CHLO